MAQQHTYKKAPSAAEQRTYSLAQPVVLVGFMGAGKSSVARKLARNFGLTSIDTDHYFANHQGMSAGAYIRAYGEAAFRDEETAVLKKVLSLPPAIVSCGGGIVEREENRELLKEQTVLFLRISADEARSRISSLDSRPLFGDIEAARALLARREALYEEVATVTIDTSGKGVGQVTTLVQRELKERGILCLQ